MILAVYKSGGGYKSEYVERLKKQCAKYAPGVPFFCLDDDFLQHGWPGWWSKMEIFKQPGPVLYIDLSSTIHGRLDPLLKAAEEYDFIVNRDPNPRQRFVQSCVMAWSGDMHWLYELFHANADKYIAEYNTARWWGDQGFIEANVENRVYWQDILPNAVASYKKHWLKKKIKDPVIVNYHGNPKPWDANV